VLSGGFDMGNPHLVSSVKLIRAGTPDSGGSFKLYLEVVDGQYTGHLVTMWVDSREPQSKTRLNQLASALGESSSQFNRASDKFDEAFFNRMIKKHKDKAFKVIWRFGDINPRITFVDEIFA
jgi:hypothetical protein